MGEAPRNCGSSVWSRHGMWSKPLQHTPLLRAPLRPRHATAPEDASPFPPFCNKVDIAGKPLHLSHYSPMRGLTTLGGRPLPQAINPPSSRTSWPHLGEMLALRGVMFTPSLFSLRRRPATAGPRPRPSDGPPPPDAPRPPDPDRLRHRVMGPITPVGFARPRL